MLWPRWTSKTQPSINKRRKDLVYCTRRLRWLMFVWGMLPLSEGKDKRMQFRWNSWRMAYSFFVYFLAAYLSTRFAFYNRFINIVMYFDDFDAVINNFMFLSYSKTQYLFSICVWFSGQKIADYHNAWLNFDEKYHRKFKEHFSLLFLEPLVNIIIVLYVVLSFALLYGQLYTLPTYTLKESVGYIPSTSIFFTYIGLIHVHCLAVQRVSKQLRKKLTMFLAREVVTKDTVVTFKYLWLDLSEITQQIGSAFTKFSALMMLGSLIDLAFSTYGYFSLRLSRANKSDVIITRDEFGLLVCVFASAYIVIHINNSCHFAAQAVKEKFVDVLCMASTRSHHTEVAKEIDSFLTAINHSSPDVYIFQSVRLNRSFISSAFSLIVTYLVVLLQFKIGLEHMRTCTH